MRTYAESKGKKPFDWNEFLNKENITEEEWDNASKLAQEWVTCACGNQCDVIPRNDDGDPKDWKLTSLGCLFFRFITLKRADDAKITLKAIEKRSAYLIDKLNKTNNHEEI